MARAKKAGKTPRGKSPPPPSPCYTLEVRLVQGPMETGFRTLNPTIKRTVQIGGEESLHTLHQLLCAAFDRPEQQMYEFVLPGRTDGPTLYMSREAMTTLKDQTGDANETTLAQLNLQIGQHFGYTYDMEAGWEHEVVVCHCDPHPMRTRVLARVGTSPPLTAPPESGLATSELRNSDAADAACLIGEMHLRHGELDKAIEAFSRALETNPTPDAYEGRARAYRSLAERDELRARALR